MKYSTKQTLLRKCVPQMTAPKYETAHQISTRQHGAPGRGLHNPVSFRPTFPPCFCFLSRCVYVCVVGEGEESTLILQVIEPFQAFSWKEIIVSWLLGKALKDTTCTSHNSGNHNSGNLQSKSHLTLTLLYLTVHFEGKTVLIPHREHENSLPYVPAIL